MNNKHDILKKITIKKQELSPKIQENYKVY